MKKNSMILGIMILVAALFSTKAQAASVLVNCTVPTQFQGLAATITGKLDLVTLVSGASQASGKLKVQLINPRTKIAAIEKQVLGQYDDLRAQGKDRYFHGGIIVKNQDDILEIYINFTRSDLSFVSYNNLTYKMQCK